MTKYRKSNRAKRVSSGCCNNGNCKICEGDRLYSSRVRSQDERHVNEPICPECFDKMDGICVVYCERPGPESERP